MYGVESVLPSLLARIAIRKETIMVAQINEEKNTCTMAAQNALYIWFDGEGIMSSFAICLLFL